MVKDRSQRATSPAHQLKGSRDWDDHHASNGAATTSTHRPFIVEHAESVGPHLGRPSRPHLMSRSVSCSFRITYLPIPERRRTASGVLRVTNARWQRNQLADSPTGETGPGAFRPR
jgi:hypothetical protein